VPSPARPAVGYALTLLAAGFFAVNGTVSTLALDAGIEATRLTALRCTGAAVFLVAVLAVVAPARLRLTWREVPFLAVFGVVGVALTQFLYYVAIGRMPVGIALVFEMTAPVFIALYVWLVRREKVRSRLWLALLLSLSGLVFVAEVWQDGGSLDPVGVGAALLAAICLATYYLMGERGTTTRDPVALTCWSFVAAAVFWAFAAPWWEFPFGELGSLRNALLAAGLVVVGTLLPFICMVAALRHVPAPRAGVVATLEPVLAAVFAWVIHDEALAAVQVAGGMAVVAAVAWVQSRRPDLEAELAPVRG